MLREPALRLPGVYFLPAAAAPAAALPPLHEAAFVGFAARGPLDRPLALDSASAFDAVFGGELVLARSADGEPVQGHLRAAVAAFFANGGRRCHVVRVAGPSACAAAFTVPGLVAVTPGAAGTRLAPRPVPLQAAWPGAWANRLALALQLESRVLPPAAFSVAGPLGLDWRAGPAPQALLPGDLLRLVFSGGRQRYFPISALALAPNDAQTVQLRADCVTATRLRGGRLPSLRLPQARPQRVERLRLLAWQRDDAGTQAPAAALSFNRGGPGFWGDALPLASSASAEPAWLAQALAAAARPGAGIDSAFAEAPVAERMAELWRALGSDRQLDWNPAGVAEQALLGARLAPHTAPHTAPPETPLPLFLPLGLSDTAPDGSDWQVADALGSDDLGERDAAANTPFVDPVLQALPRPQLPDTLLAAAWQRLYVDGVRLRGLHALFGVPAAALAALPDAVLPDWAGAAAPLLLRHSLPAGGPLSGGTRLTLVGQGFIADRTRVSLGGKPVQGLHVIDAQTLVCKAPAAATAGWADLELRVTPSGSVRLPAAFEYRDVTAPPPFADCAAPPRLERVAPAVADARGGFRVHLHGDGFTPDAAVAFGGLAARALRIVNPGLIVCETPALLPGRPVDVVVETATGRACLDAAFLPRDPRPLPTPLPLAAAPDAAGVARLLDLQQALLLLCAARADVVALLSLPQHFRRRDCIAWRSALDERLRALGDGDLLSGREGVSVASYGAVYHPWLRELDGTAAGGLRARPPDGAVCGLVAARELRRQVWVAPARVELAGAAGIELVLSDADAADLVERQFNLLRLEAGAVLPVSAHTLEPASALRQLSVRRLMILLRKLLLERGAEFAFEPNHQRLREAVKVELDQLLGRLHAQGAFAGSTPAASFRVNVDASVNPPSQVDLGRFSAVIQVAPSVPAEFILVRLQRQGSGELRVSGG